jgi:outer membrane lipoprotein SlyB
MNAPLPRAHPLVLAAAGAVLVFSLAGTAAVMGWLPSSHGTASSAPLGSATTPTTLPLASPMPQAAVPVAPQPMTPQARPAPKSVARTQPASEPAVAARPEVPAATPAPAPVARAPEPTYTEPVRSRCTDCGVVEAVNPVTVNAEAQPGVGAVLGGIAGGAAGSQMGGGRGRYVGAVLGAVGGAVAGHQVEKYVRRETAYEVVIRQDDGRVRTLTQRDAPAWRVGDRVRVSGNAIEAAS